MSKCLLSFVTDKNGQLFIHADREGLEMLMRLGISSLQKALKSDKCEDAHFMSKSWGPGELSETILDTETQDGCVQIHHVKIYSWTGEWKKKHGL